MEKWLPVNGYEGYYEVSDQGRVRSLDRVIPHLRYGRVRRAGKLLAPAVKSKYGHLGVTLCRDNREHQVHVHVLVLEAFVGACPPGQECRHINGDSSDNRLGNLAWGTRRQNSADRARHGHLTRRDSANGRWSRE